MSLAVQLRGLLDACKEEPADDAARLVLADWLEEHGQTDRAEFVRLQCLPPGAEPAGGDGESPPERAEELLARHEAEWLGALDRPDWRVSFERGLIHLRVPARELTAAAGELAGADGLAWVEAVWLESPATSHLQQPLESPLLDGVRALRISTDKLGSRAVQRLARSPHLGRLKSLGLSACKLSADLVRGLADTPRLAQLTSLDLSRNDLGGPAVRALAASPHLGGLRRLDLDGCTLAAEDVRALAGSPWLPRLHRLNLAGNRLGDEGAAALAAVAPAAEWTELDLCRTNLGPDGLRSLAAALPPQRLTSLGLARNRLGADGARALLGSASLASLPRLDLGHCHLGDDGLAVFADADQRAGLSDLRLNWNDFGEAGAAALARSPLLSTLKGLHLCGNKIGDRGGAMLLAAPQLSRLASLDLSSTDVGANSLRALGDCLASGPLLELDLGSNRHVQGRFGNLLATGWGRLSDLDLFDCWLDDSDLLAVARSPAPRHLRRLKWDPKTWNSLAALQAFAGWPGLAGLTDLTAHCGGLDVNRLLALARSPHLGGLRRFYFSGSQANAALVQALAAGLSPQRLTELTLSFSRFDDAAAEAVLEFSAYPRLRRLRVGATGLSEGGRMSASARQKLQAAFGRVLTLGHD